MGKDAGGYFNVSLSFLKQNIWDVFHFENSANKFIFHCNVSVETSRNHRLIKITFSKISIFIFQI